MKRKHITITKDTYCSQVKRKIENAGIPRDRCVYEKVSNVVSTVNLISDNTKVEGAKRLKGKKKKAESKVIPFMDQVSIARSNPASFLGKKRFPSNFLMCCGKTTALVFSTGIMVVVNAPSPWMGKYACHLYRLFLEETPFLTRTVHGKILSKKWRGRLRFDNWGIKNVVSSGVLGAPLDLEKFSEYLTINRREHSYKPQSFPGLTTKLDSRDPKTGKVTTLTCVAFSSGKFLIMGSKSILVSNDINFKMRDLAKPCLDRQGNVISTKGRFQSRLDKLFNSEKHMQHLEKHDEDLFNYRKEKQHITLEKASVLLGTFRKSSLGKKFYRKQVSATKRRRGQLYWKPELSVVKTILKEPYKSRSLLAKVVLLGQVSNVQLLLEASRKSIFTPKETKEELLHYVKDKEGQNYDIIRDKLTMYL